MKSSSKNLPDSVISLNDIHTREIKIAISRIELTRIKAFIAFLAIGLLIMSINFFLIKGTTQFFNQEYTKYVVIGWLVTFLLFEIISFFIVRTCLRRSEHYPNKMKLANITIEAAFPGVLLFLLTSLEETPIFLDSPLIFIYFILLSLSALNLNIVQTFVLGLISTISYLFVTLWAIGHYDIDNTVLHFPATLYIARSFFMFLAFLGATFVTREFKKWLDLSMNWKKQTADIEHLFGQQVSGPVAQALLKDNSMIKRDVVSILFLDIRSYSSFAEKKSPEEVITFQNNFFNPLLDVINSNNGIVNQILGDGLMATFGAPVTNPKHAQEAFDTAMQIFDEITTQIRFNKIPDIKVGIGIHSGEVVMGNIGNDLRKQFSISGNTVNVAARIEQANKEFDSKLLISESTYDKLEKGKDMMTSAGSIKMKNISEEIKLYQFR